LTITGRATVGTTISIINADTGETLKEGIKVNDRARWKMVKRGVRPTLRNITIVSSNGCAIDQVIAPSVYSSSSEYSDELQSDDEYSDDSTSDRSDD